MTPHRHLGTCSTARTSDWMEKVSDEQYRKLRLDLKGATGSPGRPLAIR